MEDDRKARIKALAARKAKKGSTQESQSIPFRNYQPPKSKQTKSELELALIEAKRQIAKTGSGMHKKVNWDLKRDIALKVSKLERRTQKAIVDLLRERLEHEAGREELD